MVTVTLETGLTPPANTHRHLSVLQEAHLRPIGPPPKAPELIPSSLAAAPPPEVTCLGEILLRLRRGLAFLPGSALWVGLPSSRGGHGVKLWCKLSVDFPLLTGWHWVLTFSHPCSTSAVLPPVLQVPRPPHPTFASALHSPFCTLTSKKALAPELTNSHFSTSFGSSVFREAF